MSTWERACPGPEGLDQILTLQLLIAWAGEADTEPPRLRWWRTAMCDVDAGEDLFQRLAPHTWQWIVLEAARVAAKRVDGRARARAADADRLISLYSFGFALDERLDDRLQELKRAEVRPAQALPGLEHIGRPWDVAALDAHLAALGKVKSAASATGRRIESPIPPEPVLAARRLAAALRPLGEGYPMPHYRSE